jgi:hypothetical protein
MVIDHRCGDGMADSGLLLLSEPNGCGDMAVAVQKGWLLNMLGAVGLGESMLDGEANPLVVLVVPLPPPPPPPPPALLPDVLRGNMFNMLFPPTPMVPLANALPLPAMADTGGENMEYSVGFGN